MRDNNLGDQIRDVVQDAMDSMDFRNLNQKIQRTVSGAMNEVRRATGPYKRKDGFGPDQRQQYHDASYNNRGFDNRTYRQRDWYRDRQFRREERHRYEQDEPVSMNKPVGKVSGVVMIVLGAVGMVAFGITSLVLYIIANFINMYTIFGPIIAVLMSIFVVALGFFIKGLTVRSRTRRFKIYQERLAENNYFQIEDVAKYLGKTSKWVAKDLLKMIRLGMFPQGHLDSSQTCFIGDNATYEQYRKAQLSYEERRKQEEEEKFKEANASEEERAILQAKATGENYITQVREANDIIQGEVMSQKLDRLELIIRKIFDHVVKHPEQLADIRKFIDYYMPITMKLVNVYKDFEHQQIEGANIASSKKEIEASLDTINGAFEKMFDSFYEDVAMEVATDISVLNTLLAQEGLTKKDFEIK